MENKNLVDVYAGVYTIYACNNAACFVQEVGIRRILYVHEENIIEPLQLPPTYANLYVR